MKFILKLFAALAVFIAVTFGIYWFNLDMKLIRKIYDLLGVHYDNMDRDKKL